MTLQKVLNFLEKYSDFIIVGCIVLIAVLFRYRGYGVINQNIMLPQVYRLADPTYMTSDWIVNTTAESFNIRTYFKYFVVYTNIVADLRVNVFLIHTIFTFIYGFFTFKIANLFFSSTKKGYIAAILVLFTTYVSLSSIPLTDRYLVPSGMSLAIGIAGLYYFFKDKYILTGVLLGVATMPQFLAGAHLVLVVGALMVLEMIATSRIRKDAIIAMLIMLGFSLLTVIPYVTLGEYGVVETKTLIKILGRVRSPHHFIPSKFGFINYLTFYLLTFLGLLVLARSKLAVPKWRVYGFYLVVNIFFLISYIFVELIPMREIFMLQFFRMSVYLSVLNFIFIACLITDAFKNWKFTLPMIVFFIIGLVANQFTRFFQFIVIILMPFYFMFKVAYDEFYKIPRWLSYGAGVLYFVLLPLLYIASPYFLRIRGVSRIDGQRLLEFIIVLSLIIYFGMAKKIKWYIPAAFLVAALIIAPKPIVLRTEYEHGEKELYEYIQQHTPEDAIFINHPRSLYSIVSIGERAHVVNWKLVSLNHKYLEEWYERMQTVATTFKTYDLEKVHDVANRYDADYIIFDNDKVKTHKYNLDSEDIIFENDRYTVIEVEN